MIKISDSLAVNESLIVRIDLAHNRIIMVDGESIDTDRKTINKILGGPEKQEERFKPLHSKRSI